MQGGSFSSKAGIHRGPIIEKLRSAQQQRSTTTDLNDTLVWP